MRLAQPGAHQVFLALLPAGEQSAVLQFDSALAARVTSDAVAVTDGWLMNNIPFGLEPKKMFSPAECCLDCSHHLHALRWNTLF